VSIVVKAEGPSGRVKIHSDDPETRIGSGPIPANYRLQRLDWGHKRQWDRRKGPKDGD